MQRGQAQLPTTIVIDLNGTNDRGEPTFGGYTAEEAIKLAVESSHPEALDWLRAWHRGDLTQMNTTPESW